MNTQNLTGRVWEQPLDLKESYGVLADACLRPLSFPEIRLDQTNLFNALLPVDDREMKPNEYCQRYSFLSYSAIYWAEHSRSLNNQEHIKIIENVLKFNNQSSVIGRGGKNYGTVLHAASAGGHQGIVQMVLEKGTNVNAQGGEYGNALQAASMGGDKEVVQILLDKGADVNAL